MPTGTEIERRDQAIMALMLLTCMRDAAVVSLKLRHIDLKRKRVFQDPRQVKTKFSKTIETVFYPVGNDVEVVFARWVKYLITERQFRSDDPLFPKTVSGHDEHRNFISAGLGREHWTNATSVRKIFRTAFERVGLPYVRPHSIRDTLTQLAYQLELTGEELKAWSQNMGHDSLVTTLNSYGHLTIERQAEIIGSLGHRQPSVSTDDDMATKIAEKIIFMLENPRT